MLELNVKATTFLFGDLGFDIVSIRNIGDRQQQFLAIVPHLCLDLFSDQNLVTDLKLNDLALIVDLTLALGVFNDSPSDIIG